MINKNTFDTTLGNITILYEDETLLFLNFTDSLMVGSFCTKHLKKNIKNIEHSETTFTQTVAHVIQAYLKGEMSTPLPFSIQLTGTNFQKNIYQQLLKIPYGATLSYTDLAVSAENPKAVRAVGHAIAKNPLLLIVPCHRIVHKNQKKTGNYSAGINRKIKLLQIEQN